jgi:hypothetical protein
MGFLGWVLWVFRVFHRIWCWGARSPTEERENHEREKEKRRRSRDAVRRSSPALVLTAHSPSSSSLLLLYLSLFLCFSFLLPKQTHSTKPKIPEKRRERENNSPNGVIHRIERLLVPRSVQEDFNRRRSLRSISAVLLEGAPEVDPRTHRLKKPAAPILADAPPILPIYNALALGLSLAPGGLQTSAWAWLDPRRGSLQTPAWVWRDPRYGFCQT